jgi:chaperonin GroEL
MIVKNLNFGNEARDKVFEGIEKLTKAVSSTLGASGKCVILEDSNGNPTITKDGVTVAENIILRHPVENMGATLLKQAAKKTVEEAGDGTTTATVLAHAILTEAYKVIDKQNIRNIKEDINSGVEKIIKYLNKISIPVKDKMLNHVATISTNNDIKLGELIANAFKSVDKTGVVMMEVSLSGETYVEIIDGAQYSKGLTTTHFITNKEKKTAELENPLVLLIDSEINSIRQIQNVLEYIIKNRKSLLIIGDLHQDVLSALAMNKTKGNIKINVIEAPTLGVNRKQILDDISLLTGAIVINENLGDSMDVVNIDYLGNCLKSITNHNETIIQIEELKPETLVIIEDIKEELKSCKIPDKLISLEKRLARLSAKIAVVKIGANSEVELREKLDRAEDAICATKAAIKEGIVPGGGIALLNAAVNIKEKNIGEEILFKAILSPYKIILQNAGIEVIKIPTKNGDGIDVLTGETVNMVKQGIIDPLLVTKCALKNAVSVATTILSTDCVINNIRVDESNR